MNPNPSIPNLLISNLSISAPSVNELVATGVAPSAGYFFFSEVWYPGWRATVNGEETPVVRVAHALRAVAVPAGEVTVRMWFAPSSWRWGLGLFGVGVVLVMTTALAGFLARFRSDRVR